MFWFLGGVGIFTLPYDGYSNEARLIIHTNLGKKIGKQLAKIIVKTFYLIRKNTVTVLSEINKIKTILSDILM